MSQNDFSDEKQVLDQFVAYIFQDLLMGHSAITNLQCAQCRRFERCHTQQSHLPWKKRHLIFRWYDTFGMSFAHEILHSDLGIVTLGHSEWWSKVDLFTVPSTGMNRK